MSEFTVCRTLDTHPALRYCLLLDDMRIAGGKPDYRGDNILISWRTKETYGPVDAIKSENKQLATEKAALERRIDELCAEVERLHAAQAHWELGNCPSCPNIADLQEALEQNAKLREQLAKARDPQRIGGTADPESFVYAIEQLREFRWQHATNDEEAIPYINNVADAHERENAKLRELVQYILDECYGDDWFGKKAEELGFKANY